MSIEHWRGGYLPSLISLEGDDQPLGNVTWHTLNFSVKGCELSVEVPVLNQDQMLAVAQHIKAQAKQVLQTLTVNEIIHLIDLAVARLLDSRDPIRREMDRLLPIVTGFDPEQVRLGLTAYLQAFRGPQLHRFVAEDFANPKVLDCFQPAVKGGAVRAYGPQLLAHLWAGNVPGLPMWSLVCGLLVKAGNIGKLPSSEPVFASLFAKLLCEIYPPLKDCLAVVWWKGDQAQGSNSAAGTLYRQAEVVLAYGGSAAMEEIRSQVPASTRLLCFGHKLGLAMIGKSALDRQKGPATARLLAMDMARWEQQGCYCPHSVYVERGAAFSPQAFAQHLAAELANLETRFVRRALNLTEAAALAAWRQAAEWRAIDSPEVQFLANEASSWAIAVHEQPQPLAPTSGYRCITVSAVNSLDEVLACITPHAAFLQTVGLATTPSELYSLADALGRVGVTRIAPIGAMAQPEAGWHHDGRFNLIDLVRMVEIDQAAELAADRLATYAEDKAL